jgi:DNA-binding response OmpR family regulator
LAMIGNVYVMEINKLRAENDRLRAEVDDFRDRGADLAERLVTNLGITRREAIVLAMIASGNGSIVHSERILCRVWGPEWSNASILKVYVSKLRTKLKPLNIKIFTHWGTGYSVSSNTAKRVAAIGIEQPQEPAKRVNAYGHG